MKLIESLVSVIVPVYNASTLLPRSVESLLRQTHQNLEIIIVDDSSKDDTYKIATILKKCDSRIRVLRNKKRYGPAICFNRALRQARGQFVTFMNPTDIASAYKIKKQVQYLLQNPKVVAVGTQCAVVKDHKNKEKTSFPEKHEQIYPTLLHGISMRFETALINRHLLPKDIIKFTTNAYPFIFSSLFLKLSQYGKLANLNNLLYTHYEEALSSYKQQNRKGRAVSYLALLLKSIAEHDYRPSLKAFLQPFTTPVRTMFR
ncbi:MAG: glycosyltransferase family 2 protein [Candidatus Levybacteria bacterium]|nr:glycosyltransferase family 2 protein [Candidatus Levybacteria bacterium]